MARDPSFAKLSEDLRKIPLQQTLRIAASIGANTRMIAAQARAAAPKDRPWLSTEDGLRTDVGKVGAELRGAIYSPRDPKGQSVGYRVEYGTSTQPPQPFLMPAFDAGRKRFLADVYRIMGGLR
jgi:hypothetical protein